MLADRIDPIADQKQVLPVVADASSVASDVLDR
jgi:hypothetical protein